MLKRLLPFLAIFAFLQILVRLTLTLRAYFEVEFSFAEIVLIWVRGLWFDGVTASFCLLPFVLYHMLLPASKHGGRGDRMTDGVFRFILSFILVFSAVAEHLFWTEFTTRFNFIAVDYLIYTQEVIGNIVESYPLHWIMLAIALVAAGIAWATLKLLPFCVETGVNRRRRFASAVAAMIVCTGLYTAADVAEQAAFKDNAVAGELAANGIYNLFHAFWHNEISYERFYATESTADVARNARRLLWEKESNFVNPTGTDLTRVIKSGRPEKHKNVILVGMESLSADYMASFGNTQNLTPSLDRLAKEGLFFTQTFATGTRTVRGLEALTLSIPPTPGQSIIRRPGNDNLFSLGFVFRDRGYDTKFIYGGYGYFDNMNAFFAGNGFDIVDRNVMPKEQVQFANVWGICDEDMFTRSIAEADAAYAKGKPFFHLIMTTSNHRPYTYPEGRIDIPPHSGRLGGVKYADYSMGKLVEDAKKKPWFKDTVFVFVADHTAGAGGKAELDPRKYHIPMIFYAPSLIKPRRFENIASQIDMAPILLGMLDFSYYTKFYGEDLLHDGDEIPHAFISNYQKVALVKKGELTVLSPKRDATQFSWPDIQPMAQSDTTLIDDAIAYYQSASWWREQLKRIPTVIEKK